MCYKRCAWVLVGARSENIDYTICFACFVRFNDASDAADGAVSVRSSADHKETRLCAGPSVFGLLGARRVFEMINVNNKRLADRIIFPGRVFILNFVRKRTNHDQILNPSRLFLNLKKFKKFIFNNNNNNNTLFTQLKKKNSH